MTKRKTFTQRYWNENVLGGCAFTSLLGHAILILVGTSVALGVPNKDEMGVMAMIGVGLAIGGWIIAIIGYFLSIFFRAMKCGMK